MQHSTAQYSTAHCLPVGEAHPRSGKPSRPLFIFRKFYVWHNALLHTLHVRAKRPKFLPRFLGCVHVSVRLFACVSIAYASHSLVSIRFERAFLKFKFAILRSSSRFFLCLSQFHRTLCPSLSTVGFTWVPLLSIRACIYLHSHMLARARPPLIPAAASWKKCYS